ncbi:MAG: cupredoxin domain-containing protein [Candidatus Limnocylindrales bacterium]
MFRPLGRPLLLPVVGLVSALVVGACAGSAQGVPTWTFPPPIASVAPDALTAATSASSAPIASTAATSASSAPVGQTAPAAPSAPPNAALAATAVGSGIVTRLDLTIVTGDMIGHTEYPAFVPSDFTLPANSTVVVTITNFDNATPLPKGAENFATVSGTVGGTMTTTPIKAAYPNRPAGASRTLSGIDPAAASHTFTILALGINVPIPAMSRTTFTIHTGAPGTYVWRCFDPCGAGATGWGTAMAAKNGFMQGTLTVA